MSFANDPQREKNRLDALRAYSILDTLPDDDYDNLTAIASEICGTPISLISLLDNDRQWFKSHHGLEISETPIEYSFCAHAVYEPNKLFVVEDARQDERFRNNPLVTGEPFIAFYAGVPLVTEDGSPLGTLCVIDRKPKRLTESQKQSLEALSRQVMKLLELRRHKHELQKANQLLAEKNSMLQKFASLAATDIKSPLNNIKNTYLSFLEKYEGQLDPKGLKLLSSIYNAARKLSSLVDGLKKSSRAEETIKNRKTEVKLKSLKDDITKLYPAFDDYLIHFFFKDETVFTNKVALQQILLNLISNAIKYNDKVIAEVEVGSREDEHFYEFFVSDNGPGIEPRDHRRIFEMFTVLQAVDRYGEYGTGIGLANVKKLVEELGGEIEVDTDRGVGSIFTFSIAK